MGTGRPMSVATPRATDAARMTMNSKPSFDGFTARTDERFRRFGVPPALSFVSIAAPKSSSPKSSAPPSVTPR